MNVSNYELCYKRINEYLQKLKNDTEKLKKINIKLEESVKNDLEHRLGINDTYFREIIY